ncbi:MAG: hypothetical protein JWN29_2448 [Acidimicrobiales bacterium]|nr:hypothetical protein [Acidimicrobiales bacterium]
MHGGISLSHPLFMMGGMATQLLLLDTSSRTWKLDRQTREIGRRGVAEAREALRRATSGDRRRPAHSQAA